MLVPIPVKLNVRKKPFIPIVEVIAESHIDVNFWIDVPLQLIEIGETEGGRLIPEKPKEKIKPNTVCFTMIFESEQKAGDFIKSIQNG